VNHSDKPNVEFEFMVHPRFGEIKCLRTLRSIRAGEELLVDYGYGAFRERTPPVWFEDRATAPGSPERT
jgi:SET domain-containing protein